MVEKVNYCACPPQQMFFVFVQMYFIFLNQKMNIYKSKFVSRFGLMHMIATNLCIWFNVLILETSHEIMEGRHATSLNHRCEMRNDLFEKSAFTQPLDYLIQIYVRTA